MDNSVSNSPRPTHFPEPVEFRGRKVMLTAQYIAAGFFIAMVGICVGFMFMFPRNSAYGYTMGGVMGACFLGMLLMPIQNIIAALSTVRVDANGLTIAGPTRTISLAWSDVESVTDTGKEAQRTLRLGVRGGGRLALRIYLYEDGDELGRLIRQRSVAPPPPSDLESKLYRRDSEAAQVFAMFAVTALGGAATYWAFQVPPKPGAGMSPGWLLAILFPVYPAIFLTEIGRYVQLTSTHLTIGNRWGKKTYSVGQIERLDGSPPKLEVCISGRAVNIPGGLADADELANRLTALCAAPQAANPIIRSLPASEIYRAAKKDRVSMIGMCLAFLGFVTWCIGAMILDPRSMGAAIFALLVFGSIGALGVYATLLGFAEFTVDGHGFARKCALGSWRVEWDAIESAWRRGTGLNTYRIVSGGRSIDADISPVAERDRLAECLRPRLTEASHPFATLPGHEFRNSYEPVFIGFIAGTVLFAVVFYFVVIATTPAGQPRASEILTFGVLFGLLLALFGGLAVGLLRRYSTTEDGLIVRSVFGKRRLKFADVTRVVSADRAQRKSNSRFRVMTIEHPEGGMFISSQVEDYALLEAYVRNRVDHALIRDEA